MSNWNIYVETSNYGWEADDAIPRPHQDLESIYISTQQKIKLADGSNAFINVETKRNKEPIIMFWAETTAAFREQIENYMLNGDKVKIVTHTSEEFIGRFLSMKRVWFTGVAPDAYDIQVSFERTA